MFRSHLYCLVNMEKSPAKIDRLSFPLFDILYSHILIWACGLRDFSSMFWFSLLSQLDFGFAGSWDEKGSQSFEHHGEENPSALVSKKHQESLCRQDVEKLMGEMGLFCSHESKELQDSFGSDDFSRLFEEKEPSLEEIKQAFDVFDLNRDGFIDAGELQRVLRILGLKEGSEIRNCVTMIRSADVNGDGKIDFKDFVKFMENSFF